jgi:uncharacterized protein YdeI (BOF family)
MLTTQKRPVSRAFALAAGLVGTVAFTFVLISTVAHASRTAPTAPGVIPAARARALPAGTLVTLDGSVTVPSGAFKSGTSDEGFALQDRSGGLYVSTAANLALRAGQRVRVTGRIADSNGQLILVPTGAGDVRARGRGASVRAQAVPTGRIGETTEGRLVQVQGRITKPVGKDLPYGYRVFFNDGSGEVQAFVYVSTGIDVKGLTPGQRIAVTGFSGQYKDHYEVIPRFQSDIRVIR